MPDKNWQFELEEYIKQGEPGRTEKSEAWQTAIGLQAVDGLNTSQYLLDTAKDHIEGKITIDEAQKRIYSYYEQRSVRTEVENETKEADIVSALSLIHILISGTYSGYKGYYNFFNYGAYATSSHNKIVNGPVSYTHLDVYKRQAQKQHLKYTLDVRELFSCSQPYFICYGEKKILLRRRLS